MTDAPWLHLLLADAPWSTMTRSRSRALELLQDDPRRRADAERDADAAFELRAQLDERRHRAIESAALNEIAVSLTTERDPEALLQTVVDRARSLLGVDLAYVGLLDGDEFAIKFTSGAITAALADLRFRRDDGLAGLIARDKQPHWTSDYQAEPAFRHMTGGDSAAAAENMRGLLGVPLQLEGHVLGALFACKRSERTFTDAEVRLLSALAAQAAVAIDNARSFERAHRAVDRLERANRELSERTAQLETALAWDRTLTDVVLGGGGVPQLLADVSRLMGRPVSLVTDRTVLPSELESLRATVEAVLDEFERDPGSRQQPVDGTDGVRTVTGHCISMRERSMGAVVVVSEGEDRLSDGDRMLLGRVAPSLALLLAADHYSTESARRAREAFVVSLLTHPAATEEEAYRQYTLAGLRPDLVYCVAVAEATEARLARSVFEEATLAAGSVIAQHGPRAVAVVPDDPQHLLASLPQGQQTTVGVSTPATGASGLAAAFVEAQQTCDALATLGRIGERTVSTEMGIYGVLLSRTGRRELEQLSERLLGPILAEEQKRGTPLIQTLSTYLGQGRRHADTAAALTIHANTLYQRLDTIDRLIGTGWRDPDAALDLQVLLRLRRSGLLLER